MTGRASSSTPPVTEAAEAPEAAVASAVRSAEGVPAAGFAAEAPLSALAAPVATSEVAPATSSSPAAPATGRRRSKMPLIVVAKARAETDALAGLERWKQRHPEAAAHLQPADVLTDAMRGRSSTWTRIRVNLRHVPEAERPPAEAPDPDYDPWHDRQ